MTTKRTFNLSDAVGDRFALEGDTLQFLSSPKRREGVLVIGVGMVCIHVKLDTDQLEHLGLDAIKTARGKVSRDATPPTKEAS